MQSKSDTELLCVLSFEFDGAKKLRRQKTESFSFSEKEMETFVRLVTDAPDLLKNLAFQYVVRFHPDLRKECLDDLET